MRRLIGLLIFCILIFSCGSKQQDKSKFVSGKTDLSTSVSDNIEAVKTNPEDEFGRWKIVSYAGNLGDNKNSYYITNTYAIWGTYKNATSDNAELKVKFLVDKVSFCFKLYECGKKIVKKGDENFYKITIQAEGYEPIQIIAKNVSDRIFINELDAKKIIGLFNKGAKITFSMVTDSKTSTSSYAFVLYNPVGISDALKKLSN